jgi:hypothetical protein
VERNAALERARAEMLSERGTAAGYQALPSEAWVLKPRVIAALALEDMLTVSGR